MTCALLERDLIPREYYEKIIWPKQWTAFSPVVAFLVEMGLRVTWAPGDVCVSLLILFEFSVNDTYLLKKLNKICTVFFLDALYCFL